MFIICFQLSIEFLDLSGVDEKEQIKLRISLQHNDPSVQLPWIKSNKKQPIAGKFDPLFINTGIYINLSDCTIMSEFL